MVETTEGSCLTERTKKEKKYLHGAKRQVLASRPDRKMRSRLGLRGVAGVMWAHTQRNGAGLVLSTSQLRGSADGQAKARPIFLKRLQWCISAESVLLLEEANTKDRQALWEKTHHFRVRLLSASMRSSTLDSSHQEFFPKPVQGFSRAESAQARLAVVGQVGCHAMLCHPMHGAAGRGSPGSSSTACTTSDGHTMLLSPAISTF